MGRAKRVPASKWGDVIAVCEAMGWSYAEYGAAPYEMIDEIEVRLDAKQYAEKQQRFAAQAKQRMRNG